MYIIADNENDSLSKIKNIENKINTDFKYHIWNTNFEEDNFGKDDVIKIFNKKLNKYDQKIYLSEIMLQQKNNAGFITAIANAYSEKYHEDIYKKIGLKKSDIILELMSKYLKHITPESSNRPMLPIEKILNEAFKMIPYTL